ncbi:MAG: hypothetical protein HY537_16570, partial [Deltaproteobacteria bacterium]|nr:hypothetical protein [Deltaproteobacteria bacterium]
MKITLWALPILIFSNFLFATHTLDEATRMVRQGYVQPDLLLVKMKDDTKAELIDELLASKGAALGISSTIP